MPTMKYNEATTITMHFEQFGGTMATGLTVTGALYREGAATAVATGIAMPASAADATGYVATLAGTLFATPGKYQLKAIVTDNAAAVAVISREQVSETIDVQPSWVTDITSRLAAADYTAPSNATITQIADSITLYLSSRSSSIELTNGINALTDLINGLSIPADNTEALSLIQLTLDHMVDVLDEAQTKELASMQYADLRAAATALQAALDTVQDTATAIDARLPSLPAAIGDDMVVAGYATGLSPSDALADGVSLNAEQAAQLASILARVQTMQGITVTAPSGLEPALITNLPPLVAGNTVTIPLTLSDPLIEDYTYRMTIRAQGTRTRLLTAALTPSGTMTQVLSFVVPDAPGHAVLGIQRKDGGGAYVDVARGDIDIVAAIVQPADWLTAD
ncbi:MAG TPA: hypothetical protein VGL77_20330 [Armatimonadota bacterium]